MARDVASPLPDLDLAEGSTITIMLDAPGAVVTSLVIHGYQLVPAFVPPTPAPLLSFTPEPLPPIGDASDRDEGAGNS